MKENVSPPRLKWGISLIMTLVYAFGAAWFYYLPSRGEPELDVTFWGLLSHFLLLSFLFWIILIPELKSDKREDVLLMTILTVPAGLGAALLLSFALGGRESWYVEVLYYFALSLVPFVLSHRAVRGRLSPTPFVLAAVYAVLAYAWGYVSW
ncbi:hypothetical protein [Thermococcus sp. ES12]|uniref:hypothetical protein n=1 Tax=Thermococcus sp. ES12 TaxID=1638246 RepID=UPI00143139A2|nr:hypothetical protein [Thermococcus sp. ES12]NJE75730.1 hypothetical protein [Thermococcus sp. ES12]